MARVRKETKPADECLVKCCQTCGNYSREARKCGVSNTYTARKNYCEENYKEVKR